MDEYVLEKEFLDMISIFAYGAVGSSVEMLSPVNMEKVERWARNQGVWPIVFYTVEKLYLSKDNRKLNLTKTAYEQMLNNFIDRSARQINRQYVLNKLYQTLEKEQIKFCILKGESLAHLYNIPFLRFSHDTDIYIDIKDEKRVSDILRILDYQILPFNQNSHHIVAEHEIAGRVEIHLKLYGEIVTNIWFNNKSIITEDYRKVKTSEGIWIPTLGITDNLIFITLHFIKHFVNTGVGVRQLMDIVLYIKYYRSEIDWNRYNKLLNYLKFNKILNHILGIGINYLGINADDLPPCHYDVKILNHMLLDMQIGGIFGKNEQSPSKLREEFTKTKWEDFRESLPDADLKLFKPKLLNMILPNKDNLAVKFPYLKTRPFLYPIAVFHRFIMVTKKIVSGERRITQYILQDKDPVLSKTYNRRIKLIKELEMI